MARLKASASSYAASRLFIVDRRFAAWAAEEFRAFRISFDSFASFSLGDFVPSLFWEPALEAALDCRFTGE